MDISINKIDSIKPVVILNLYDVREIMTSNKINEDEKIKFLKENHDKIKCLAEEKISGTDYEMMMEQDP